MLCAKCQERDATVHFTIIDGSDGSSKRVDLCMECAAPEMGAQKGIELRELLGLLRRGEWTPGAMIKTAIGANGRYPLEAYEFVRKAIREHQQKEPGDVSARELLQAIKGLALEKFGKGARKALAQWKIFRTEDFGEIVFEMVDAGVLSKNPDDSKEDFANGFGFEEAFPEE
jgi:uncharacterized repeat protein (TIGR04138 family)